MELATLLGVSFMLHLIWERLHIRLYTGYEKMEGKLPVYLFATFGDVMYAFVAVGLFAVYKGDALWFLAAQPLEYLGLAFCGFCIALFVEYKAMALERWKYLPTMPIIPGLRVGLSPILQMTVLLPLSVFIAVALSEWLW